MQLSFIVPAELQSLGWEKLAGWASTNGFAAVDAETSLDTDTAAVVRKAGIELGPMRIRASLADSDPATRAEAVRTAIEGIDHAVALGLRTVWTLPRNFRNDASTQANFDAAVESLRPVVAHAEKHGVRIAIENCPFDGQNAVCTPESWDALFHHLPSPNLGICLDPSHCVWQGIDYRRVIVEYGRRILHAHAKDAELLPEGMFRYGVAGRQLHDRLDANEAADPRQDGAGAGWWRHRLPGLGAVDWNMFVTALADAGYDGSLSIEHEDPLWEGDPATVQRGLCVARDHLLRFVPGGTA